MTTTHEEIAEHIRDAYLGQPIPPLRDGLEPGDVDSAYAIQQINTQYWMDNGRKIVGRKIGLTSAAVQQQLGVDQPDFGVLFEDMRVVDGGALPPGRLIQPKAEAEIALVLESDLPFVNCSPEQFLDACAYAVAAIEVVDSRIRDWQITFADTVADNGSSGLFVLGSERKPLAGLDMYSCGMVLERNGEIASLGAGGACLGHPLKAAAWLASVAAQKSQPLTAGDIVLTGALGPMIELQRGDHVTAIIGGLGRCSFSYLD